VALRALAFWWRTSREWRSSRNPRERDEQGGSEQDEVGGGAKSDRAELAAVMSSMASSRALMAPRRESRRRVAGVRKAELPTGGRRGSLRFLAQGLRMRRRGWPGIRPLGSQASMAWQFSEASAAKKTGGPREAKAGRGGMRGAPPMVGRTQPP